MAVRTDILSLTYLVNCKANITVKTLLGDTEPFPLSNLIKQETVLGPVLNNCFLNKVSTDSIKYNYETVQIKSMEFLDDFADSNKDIKSATVSN